MPPAQDEEARQHVAAREKEEKEEQQDLVERVRELREVPRRGPFRTPCSRGPDARFGRRIFVRSAIPAPTSTKRVACAPWSGAATCASLRALMRRRVGQAREKLAGRRGAEASGGVRKRSKFLEVSDGDDSGSSSDDEAMLDWRRKAV